MFKTIFMPLVLLMLFTLRVSALEISLQGAKYDHQKYSILHIKDNNKFLCQKVKDEFDVTTEIICAFSSQPTKKLNKIQNDFFDINTRVQRKTFFVIIKPYKKMKLIPIVFDLSKEETVYSANVKLSKHWIIVGYIENIPFSKFEKYNPRAINFPFSSDSDMLPFVGGLDLSGNPVHIKQVNDVKAYIKVKRFFDEKKYEMCLDLVDEVLLEFPNTLFKSELLYYKILVFDKLTNYDGIVELSKIYLREYSSNENIAQILSLTANAYAKLGQNTDADYFFERLFDEHKASKYAQWGYIYKGEMLEGAGTSNKAIAYYKKALKSTRDLDVAATAAFRIGTYKINFGDKDEAAKYIQKIIKAKPSFFASEYKVSKETMQAFAQQQKYEVAAEMANCLLENITHDHDDAEILLKNVGVWLAKTDKKTRALKFLNKYLEQYAYGMFDSEVQVAKDSLFFEGSDDNLSVKLANYDALIEKYVDDTIGERALYEKATLLLENKKFKEVLTIETQLLALDSTKYKDIADIIHDAAIGLMKVSLENKQCKEVLRTSDEYNVTLSDSWDDGLYGCSMKGADYTLAKSIASKNFKSKNLDHRKKWLYRYIKVDFATGNYSEVIGASRDLITLIEDDKNSKYLAVYRYLFDTYQRLEQDTNIINTMTKIQKVFGLDYKDIERYVAVMSVGSQTKNDNIVIKYGSDIMKIQRESSSYAQSPFVEFTLYEAYMKKERFEEALSIIKSLEDRELSNILKARQKYLLGNVYSKLWRDEDALVAFDEAIKADSESPWATLAKDAKSIIN